MSKLATITAYFHALESKCYDQIIRLFEKEATIHSPLYGVIKAEQFYKKLFNATDNSKISLKNIFISESNPSCAAAHFLYNWALIDGTLATFECIDIFEFSTNGSISSLKIIYDTYPVRKNFEQTNHSTSK